MKPVAGRAHKLLLIMTDKLRFTPEILDGGVGPRKAASVVPHRSLAMSPQRVVSCDEEEQESDGRPSCRSLSSGTWTSC